MLSLRETSKVRCCAAHAMISTKTSRVPADQQQRPDRSLLSKWSIMLAGLSPRWEAHDDSDWLLRKKPAQIATTMSQQQAGAPSSCPSGSTMPVKWYTDLSFATSASPGCSTCSPPARQHRIIFRQKTTQRASNTTSTLQSVGGARRARVVDNRHFHTLVMRGSGSFGLR